jgi:hypothetical protein
VNGTRNIQKDINVELGKQGRKTNEKQGDRNGKIENKGKKPSVI